MFRGSPWRYVSLVTGFSWGFLIGLGCMLLYRASSDYGIVGDCRFTFAFVLLVSGILVLAVSARVSRYAEQKVLYRPQGAIAEPQTYSASEAGLIQRSKYSEQRTAWSAFEAVERDSTYIYLFLDRGYATCIPIRAFENQTQCEEFISVVNRYVSSAQG